MRCGHRGGRRRRVHDFAAGDAVTVIPLDWCERCPACAAGHRHVCQNLVFVGIDATGAMQQSWTVPERLLVRVAAAAWLLEGALSEPVAVAVHDVRRGAVRRGERVLVVGGGPIGLLIACVAAVRHLKRLHSPALQRNVKGYSDETISGPDGHDTEVCALASAQESTGQRVVVPARNTTHPRVVKASLLNSGITVKTHAGKDVIVESTRFFRERDRERTRERAPRRNAAHRPPLSAVSASRKRIT